jgi:hypothetical protein
VCRSELSSKTEVKAWRAVAFSAGGDGGRLSKNGNGCPKNSNRVFVNNEVKNSRFVGRRDVNETRRADTRMTSPEYDGDNPLRLANEIDAALAKYGLGNDHRMCKAIHFFEGELRLIAECLRCAGPQKVAKQPPSSTRPASTSKASLTKAVAA